MSLTQVTSTLINQTTQNLFMPVGTIIQSAVRIAPSGFLLCDGSAVSRTTFSSLFSAIVPLLGNVGISNGTNATISLSNHGIFTGEAFYLTTTGTLPSPLSANTLYYAIYVDANTFRIATTYTNALAGTAITTTTAGSGTHSFYYCPFGFSSVSDFKVPDLIGATTRMRGTSTGYSQNVTASMGSKQDDQFQGHKVQLNDLNNGTNTTGISGSNLYNTGGGNSSNTSLITDGTNGTPRTGNETRMKNVGVNFFIKT